MSIAELHETSDHAKKSSLHVKAHTRSAKILNVVLGDIRHFYC